MRIGSTKTYLLAVLISLALLYFFSFGILMGMETDNHGQMTACPFTMMSSICTMSFSEHLNLWQSLFTVTINNSVLLAIVGLIMLVILLAFKYFDISQDQQFKTYKLYTHEHPNNSTFNKLLELFSQGILNPKIYELAAI